MQIELKPLHGLVFIKPEEHTPVESATIIIPESVKNRDMPDRGTVFAIGCRRITRKGVVIDHEFKQGDRVLFKKHSGLWVEVRGVKLIQIEAKDVQAILQPA